jgi:mRNA interferase RelE/StbE
MYNVLFTQEAEKEFLKITKSDRKLIAQKILELKKGNFHNDKPLKGKYRGKFRKRAGNYRIIYLKEESFLIITIIRIAHRKEVY